jgi:hypothetical protein
MNDDGILIHPTENTIAFSGDDILRTACNPPCCGEQTFYYEATACSYTALAECEHPESDETIYVLESVLCDGGSIAGKVVTFNDWCYRVAATASVPDSAIPEGATRITEDQAGCVESCDDAGCSRPRIVRYERCGTQSPSLVPKYITFCEKDAWEDACAVLQIPFDRGGGTVELLCYQLGDEFATFAFDDGFPEVDFRGQQPAQVGTLHDSCCACREQGGQRVSSACGSSNVGKASIPECLGIECCQNDNVGSGQTFQFTVSARLEIDDKTFGWTGTCLGQGLSVRRVDTWQGTVTFRSTGGDYTHEAGAVVHEWEGEQYAPGDCGDPAGSLPFSGSNSSTQRTWQPGSNPTYAFFPQSLLLFTDPRNTQSCNGPSSAVEGISEQFDFLTGYSRYTGSRYCTWTCNSSRMGFSMRLERYRNRLTDSFGNVNWPGANQEEQNHRGEQTVSITWNRSQCGCDPTALVPVEDLV